MAVLDHIAVLDEVGADASEELPHCSRFLLRSHDLQLGYAEGSQPSRRRISGTGPARPDMDDEPEWGEELVGIVSNLIVSDIRMDQMACVSDVDAERIGRVEQGSNDALGHQTSGGVLGRAVDEHDRMSSAALQVLGCVRPEE